MMSATQPAMRIGIVATSSAVPMVELGIGAEKLRDAGFDVRVHPSCGLQHFTFAGDDASRAAAFLEYAYDPSIDIIWCARGGYGATRILPLLEEMTQHRGAPEAKLLVGYSDATALHHFVSARWGWHTLHAPMPGGTNLQNMSAVEWPALIEWVCKRPARPPWSNVRLAFLAGPIGRPIEGELVGGNLTVWNCLTGTPFMPRWEQGSGFGVQGSGTPGIHRADGRGAEAGRVLQGGPMLFLEDVGEAWYRIDRMMTQLVQSGGLDGVRAILLGDFLDCKDEPPMGLMEPGSDQRQPVRRRYEPAEAIREVFVPISRRLGIPVVVGLPVGHGPNFCPLPLGARYRLTPEGSLEMLKWDWLSDAGRSQPPP